MRNIIELLRNLFPVNCHQRVFLVGGSVRDQLLARPGRDIDLAAALSEDELTSCGFHLVAGRSTAPIWFRHDEANGTIELTRLEDAAALETDLPRRDFTINALALNLSNNLDKNLAKNLEDVLIDPLGGRGDLEQGILRACSRRSFIDDPLRIFRAFRFEAEGWCMSEETMDLIRQQEWSQSLQRIPVERFSREMLKACASPQPQIFFLRMAEFVVGAEYLPELFRMAQIPAGPPQHHPEGDLLTHSIQVLQRVAQRSDDPLARFCAFFHDIGKLATDPACYPAHHGHDEAGFELGRDFCDRLRLPAAYRTALAWTSRLHGRLNKWDELRDSTKLRTAEQALKGGIGGILPLVSAADKGGEREPADWGTVIGIARMTTAELDIDPLCLKSMPDGQRADFILQKRVEKLRCTPDFGHVTRQ